MDCVEQRNEAELVDKEVNSCAGLGWRRELRLSFGAVFYLKCVLNMFHPIRSDHSKTSVCLLNILICISKRRVLDVCLVMSCYFGCRSSILPLFVAVVFPLKRLQKRLSTLRKKAASFTVRHIDSL